jgi:thymidine kinase
MDAVMKQIDEISALIRNTTSVPIKQSMLSKIRAAIKASKIASKTAGAGKLAFKLGANAVTFGGYGIAVNLIKKLGIGKREMTYLKDAMDFRFMKKITSNSTLTTAMFKSNKKLTARELASLGIPPWIYARPTKEMYNWFNTLQKTNPLKWKQISNTIGKQSADANNPYYAKFVENAFSQASNIFRPGTVLKAGYPKMFAKVFKLDSYQNTNIIFIEEAQFFSDIYQIIKKMTDIDNKIIYLSALNGDSNRELFGEIHKLIPLADNIEFLRALCTVCNDGTDGIYSKRLSNDKCQILVAGADQYNAVCRKHYLEK